MEIKGIFPSNPRKRRPAGGGGGRASLQPYEDDTTTEEGSGSFAPDLEGGASTIACVVENRAREVCICKLKTSNRYLLEITIISDGHAYNETMLLLNDIAPQEILLHDGCRKRVLTKKIESTMGATSKIIFISRQYFDQDRGAEMLARVKAGAVDSEMIAKYTVLSASHCLLKYVENCTGTQFPSHSLRIAFDTGFDVAEKMSIDRRSAIHLELVADNVTGDQYNTLFGMVNYCKTTVGTRLLRSNILRPLTNIHSIQGRQSLVETLLRNNATFADIAATLVQFPDLDKMLNGLSYVPKSMTLNTVRTGIDTLLFIKHTIAVARTLAEILRKLEQNMVTNTAVDPTELGRSLPMVQRLMGNLHNEGLTHINEIIAEILAEQSKYSKSSQEMRFQECFAIKSGVNGMLDVARKTYLQAVEEMYELAEQYSRRDGIPIKVHYTSSRGYFLSVSSDLPSLPSDFVQAVLNKKTIYCSTVDMIYLSDRTIESIDQALSISHDIIQSTLERMRENIELLFNLVDSVALLDMIASFADVVALSNDPFVKPNLVEEGPLVIRSGRHPIVSKLQLQRLSSGPFVANDVLLSELESFCVVTGPNGSGKTIFLKQLALIVILAQIGCFVPATYALIPIRDKILTRIGNNDDIEHNMSTFSVEMKEAAYITDNCTQRSLVLIDELGRGSSIIDGLSIAMAVAEELILTRAYVLFVTHFSQIPSLQDMYPTVKNVHLRARLQYTANDSSNAPSALSFSHEIAAGPCALQSGYGIVLSEMCGFPRDVVDCARVVRMELADKFSLTVHADKSLAERHISADPFNRAVLQQAMVVLQSNMDRDQLVEHLVSMSTQLSHH